MNRWWNRAYIQMTNSPKSRVTLPRRLDTPWLALGITVGLSASPTKLQGQGLLNLDFDLRPIQELFQSESSKGSQNDLSFPKGSDAGSPQIQRPPMGWSIVTADPACEVSEASLKNTIHRIFETGLSRYGFQYVILENCWYSILDGKLAVDPIRFPNGLKPLAEALHEKGLKFGLNVPIGSCREFRQRTPPTPPFSSGGFNPSSRTPSPDTAPSRDISFLLADWGVDLVRLSPMSSCDDTPEVRLALYQSFTQSLRSEIGINSGSNNSANDDKKPVPKDNSTPTRSPMPLLSLNDPSVLGSGAWALEMAPLWTIDTKTPGDWQGLLDQAYRAGRFAAFSGSGHWNEAGPLWPHHVATTLDQKKAQWGLWTLLGAPLFIRYHESYLDKAHRKIITNPEVLALFSDRIGLQALPGLQNDRMGVWIKPIAQSGQRVVLIINKTSTVQTVKFNPLDLGLDSPFMVRDLWDEEMLPPHFQWQIPPFGSVLFKAIGKERPPESGDLLLTDKVPVYSAGLLPKGQEGIRLISGIRYSRSLTVDAPSVVRYFLGGQCQRFKTLVGLDDKSPKDAILGAEVWGDGNLLARSKSLNQQSPMTALDINVEGLNYLDLAVQAGGPGFTSTSGSWVHPLLSCRGNIKSEGP